MRFTALVVVLSVLCGVATAGELKMAVVDMGKLLKAHPETEKAEASLEEQIKEIEAEKERLMEKLEGMQAELEEISKKAKNPALSDEAKEAARSELEQKFKELRKADMEAKRTMESRKQDLAESKLMMHKRIVGEISDAVAKYAEKKDYTVVLDSSGMGVSGMPSVIYAAETTDITTEIEKLLKK